MSRESTLSAKINVLSTLCDVLKRPFPRRRATCVYTFFNTFLPFRRHTQIFGANLRANDQNNDTRHSARRRIFALSPGAYAAADAKIK
jgi:hypothetical protein